MHLIDGLNTTSSLPTPAPVGTPGWFQMGTDPATSTQVTGDWLNGVQAELLNTITGAGLTPSKTSQNQLLTAISVLAQPSRGLRVACPGGTSVTIAPGLTYDDSFTSPMLLANTATVSISANGANGLDTGTAAANTWYYVWLILNRTTNTVAGLLSTSRTAPTMPTGYDRKVLLPATFRTDGSGVLLKMACMRWGRDTADWVYDAGRFITNIGAPTGFTTVSGSAFFPPNTGVALLAVTSSISGDIGAAGVRPTGSTGTSSSNLGGQQVSGNLFTRLNSTQQFDFAASGTVAGNWGLSALGYSVEV